MSDEPNIDDEKTLIYDRYELIRVLGQGGQATTWLARDLATDRDVALKELLLERVVDWKAVELFEREGQALASIDHPRVPDYIDAFHIEDDEGRSRFFLAQEYVSGESLASRIESGLRMDVEEVAELLEALLSVLAYLHDRLPPIIHRDIKPSNILINEDGEAVLVDFGAVQLVLPNTVGGSTIVGTTGFFPMEQLMGKAVPASDLYAVGATIVHVMSGTHPAQLDMTRNRLHFEPVVDAPSWLEAFLGRLLEPAAEDRFDDAGDALSFYRKLRANDGALAKSPDDGALQQRDGDWLQVSNGRVLVDDRATPESGVSHQVPGRRPPRRRCRAQARPGRGSPPARPGRAPVPERDGARPGDAEEFCGARGIRDSLRDPAAAACAHALLAGGLLGFTIYFVLRHQAKTRHMEIRSDRILVTDRGRNVYPQMHPRNARLEARDGELVLKSDAGGETTVASGLATDQAEWLAAKMERARSELVEHKQIALDREA